MTLSEQQLLALPSILDNWGPLPHLPDIAAAMLRLLNQEENDTEELANIIASDPALAARVLRVANSPYYGFTRQIKTIRDATVLLGQKTLRNLVLTVALKGLYQLNSPIEKKLWEESMAHALGSQFLAITFKTGAPEEAFLAGLLANIGELICQQQRPSDYLQLLNSQTLSECTRDQLSGKNFSWTFSQLGAAVLNHWKFSTELVLSTLYSCQPQHPKDMEPELSNLAHFVFLSRCLSCLVHLGDNPPECRQSFNDQIKRTTLNANGIDSDVLKGEFEAFHEKKIKALLHA